MKKFLSFILSFLVIILFVLIYSRFVGTIGLDTKEINLRTDIGISYNGLKIVHFADLHYKRVITEKRVKEVVDEINRIEADIVLFTGDMLDNNYTMTNEDINFLIEQLSRIETKYGVYAVLGDHDVKHEEVLKNIYIQSNFTLLKNESITIHNENNDKILLTGLDSYLEGNSDINSAISSTLDIDNITYRIVMMHEPDYITKVINEYDKANLILASHSINGSINIPIIRNLLLPNGSKEYNEIENKINNTDIFVSNGIGVNQINFRLFNTPSINFYRIHKESNNISS